jgi:hypothetical protein
MPQLLGAALLAIGGMVAMRVLRKEWRRVNQSMDEQRRAPKQSTDSQRLERDPDTGTYRPADD